MAAIAAAAIGLYVQRNALPACTSDRVQDKVYAALRDRFHLDSIFLNDIRTIDGGYFGDRHDCSAEVTEIRGNVAASTMPWRQVQYRIARQNAAQAWVVTVALGDSVPLAPKRLTFWQRLFGSS